MLPRYTNKQLSLAYLLLTTLCIFLSSVSSFSTSTDMERPSQFYSAFCEELPSLDGKTVAITGGSRGLGFVTARTVAQKGGRVVVMNRASKTATNALQQISEIATGPSPTMIECDLQNFQSVKKACSKS